MNTKKAVFSRVAKPRVKIPLLVFMSEIKKRSFTEKVKFSISFLLKNCNNLVYQPSGRKYNFFPSRFASNVMLSAYLLGMSLVVNTVCN